MPKTLQIRRTELSGPAVFENNLLLLPEKSKISHSYHILKQNTSAYQVFYNVKV